MIHFELASIKLPDTLYEYYFKNQTMETYYHNGEHWNIAGVTLDKNILPIEPTPNTITLTLTRIIKN